MTKAIELACRALAHLLEAHWKTYDRETSAVLLALADYVAKHGS